MVVRFYSTNSLVQLLERLRLLSILDICLVRCRFYLQEFSNQPLSCHTSRLIGYGKLSWHTWVSSRYASYLTLFKLLSIPHNSYLDTQPNATKARPR